MMYEPVLVQRLLIFPSPYAEPYTGRLVGVYGCPQCGRTVGEWSEVRACLDAHEAAEAVGALAGMEVEDE